MFRPALNVGLFVEDKYIEIVRGFTMSRLKLHRLLGKVCKRYNMFDQSCKSIDLICVKFNMFVVVVLDEFCQL